MKKVWSQFVEVEKAVILMGWDGDGGDVER